jgi:peptidoglycan hydrolase-like protein with peptidoglycan-binding domain
VNFGAWGPSGSETAGSNAVQGNADISALGTSTLRKGAKGEQVEALQRMLNEKTGGNLEVDGKFGKDTLAALKKYQESQGLESDGVVGKDTRAAFAGAGANQAAAPGAVAPAGDATPTAPDAGAAPDAPAPDAATPPAAANEANPEATPPAEPSKAGAEGSEAQGTEAAKTKALPGTEDTSWTETLPEKLKPHAQAFIDAGKKHGVDPRFLASISMHESAKGTSYSMRKRNNAMGIMKGNKHRTFDSVAASINAQAKSLTRDGGHYVGKHTISAIGKTYAPVGATNDPGNLNRHWIPSITKNYKALGGDSTGRVTGFDTNS